MSFDHQPIIAGAGPVGLGAALFLAQHGQVPRVVEMRERPSEQSKALAVNPRTLDILQPTGVTKRMLELGLPVRGVRFHRQGHADVALSLAGIHPRYPFMLALSQATTERLLAQALQAAGGSVERGVKMVDCRNINNRVDVTLESSAGSREVAQCPWLLAADGAHSIARQQLGIDFVGSSFAEEWYLADAPLRTRLASDEAHVFFLDRGAFLFLIRVIDEALKNRPDPIWRVIGNRPEPLFHLVDAEQAGPAVWSSGFHISHRINSTMAAGEVYFAGDAAHIHSPLGARGMNLGLEDAWVFAHLALEGRLSEYNALRHPIDRQVVRQVKIFSSVASGESRFNRLLQAFLFPNATKIPLIRQRLLTTVTGLDHELPELAVSVAR